MMRLQSMGCRIAQLSFDSLPQGPERRTPSVGESERKMLFCWALQLLIWAVWIPCAPCCVVGAKTETKIHELITTLDMRKNEAIERTFKGVAKNFRYPSLHKCERLLLHMQSIPFWQPL